MQKCGQVIGGGHGFALAVCVLLAACTGPDSNSEAYRQACHGEPLSGQAAIYEAEADGYRINSRYRCIDRQSWDEVQQALARIEYERRPDVQALRQVEADREHAQRLQQIAERTRAREQAATSAVASPVVQVDANTASLQQLTAVCAVDADGAQTIVQARSQDGRFTDWSDLVRRVLPLSAAQSALLASRCGLVVNGQSLPGGEPGQTQY